MLLIGNDEDKTNFYVYELNPKNLMAQSIKGDKLLDNIKNAQTILILAPMIKQINQQRIMGNIWLGTRI